MLIKITNKKTKACDVFVGSDTQWALAQGFMEGKAEKSYNGAWYVEGYAPKEPKRTYGEKRADAYPPDVEQLDMLYHDIDKGLLGKTAQASSFYLARKDVKEAFPK